MTYRHSNTEIARENDESSQGRREDVISEVIPLIGSTTVCGVTKNDILPLVATILTSKDGEEGW